MCVPCVCVRALVCVRARVCLCSCVHARVFVCVGRACICVRWTRVRGCMSCACAGVWCSIKATNLHKCAYCVRARGLADRGELGEASSPAPFAPFALAYALTGVDGVAGERGASSSCCCCCCDASFPLDRFLGMITCQKTVYVCVW